MKISVCLFLLVSAFSTFALADSPSINTITCQCAPEENCQVQTLTLETATKTVTLVEATGTSVLQLTGLWAGSTINAIAKTSNPADANQHWIQLLVKPNGFSDLWLNSHQLNKMVCQTK